VAKVSEILAEHNVSPVIQILRLLKPDEEGGFSLPPIDRAKLWLQLQSYCEAKPKSVETLDDDGVDQDEFKNISNEDLKKLIPK